jgi:hypothetical protein
MSNKKTFTADKIKTDEICGITGGPVTICGIDSVSAGNISGSFISGDNLVISGDGNSVIDVKSGVFDEILINGVRYIPREQIAYAFRFGGPPVDIPSRLPRVTGAGFSATGYDHLHANTNLVFVEDSSSFQSGDHILVGGIHNKSNTQEQHIVTGVSYYRPDNCCQAKTTAAFSADISSSVTHYDASHTGYQFSVNDKIKFEGSDTVYTVTETDVSTSNSRYVNITPNLTDSVADESCVCLVVPTLETQVDLSNNFALGQQVANKFASTSTGLCDTGCYDSRYLYLEQAMYKNETFDWDLTGYRESYIGFSGIEWNITGKSTSGLMTMVYPET